MNHAMPDAKIAVSILLNCCLTLNSLLPDSNLANIPEAPIRSTNQPPLRNSFKIDFSGSIVIDKEPIDCTSHL